MTQKQRRGEQYQIANSEAAAIILADVERYDGSDSLMVRWARRVIDQPAVHTAPTVSEARVKNTKAKGNRNEHRSMAVLEAAGYRCTRSAASLGEWDIVGIGSADVVLCQVKTRDWPGTVEMENAIPVPGPPNARKLVHRWRERQRLPDVREIA
jgi:hypothetical protein